MPPVALFDLDDTLIGRVDAFRRWWEAESKRRGLPTSALAGVVDIEAGRYRLERDLFDSIADHLDLDVDRDRWFAAFREDYPHHVRVAPATVRGLVALRADGYAIGIVTNGYTAEQTAKIRLTGLDRLVDGWAISQAENSNKPDPAVFTACAERIGVDLADGGWMVGDNITADIGGGDALGLSTIWIPHGAVRVDADPVPTHVAANIVDAIDIIRRASSATFSRLWSTVLLVDGLPTDPELIGDLLPGPSLLPGTSYLGCLLALDDSAQSNHGTQADGGIGVGGANGEASCLLHTVNVH